MQEDNTQESNLKNEGSNKSIVIISLIIVLLILSGLGYFLFREYKKKYIDNVATTSQNQGSNFIPSQIALSPTPATLISYSQEKITLLNELLEKLSQNPGFSTESVATFNIQGTVVERNEETDDQGKILYKLDLRDTKGNTLTLFFTPDEVREAKVYTAKDTGNINEVGFFNLKANDVVEINTTIVLTSKAVNKHLIRILSR